MQQKNIPRQFAHQLIRIIVLFFCITLLSVLVTLTTITWTSNRQLYQVTADRLRTSAERLDESCRRIEDLSRMMAVDAALQDDLAALLSLPTDGSAYRTVYGRLYNQCVSYCVNNDTISRMYLVVNREDVGGASLSYSVGNSKRLGAEDIAAITQAVAVSGEPSWHALEKDADGIYLARCVREIRNVSLRRLAVLVIRFDLKTFIDRNFHQEDSLCLLLSGDKLIYADRPGTLTEKERAGIQRENAHNPVTVNVWGRRYLPARCRIECLGWDLFYLLLSSTVSRELFMVYFLCIAAVVAVFVFTLACDLRKLRYMRKWLEFLIAKIGAYSRDVFASAARAGGPMLRQDEFSYMNEQLDCMAERIRTLIEENYAQKMLRMDAEYKALQQQINPHFLYNTLESIHCRSRDRGDGDTSSMARALARLLRYSMQTPDRIPIGRELDIVNCFITLQRLRFGERFHYTQQVDESLLEKEIPKMCIQPIVENAATYALDEVDEDCRVDLRVYAQDGCTWIRVRNSGTEFPERFMERLEAGLIPTHGSGISLLNIHNRLRIAFGERAGIRVANEDGWAVVSIALPDDAKKEAISGETADCGR